jgi:hypothetical protein
MPRVHGCAGAAGNFPSERNGGSGGIRTHDQWIKSPVLYRLSYRPTNVLAAEPANIEADQIWV